MRRFLSLFLILLIPFGGFAFTKNSIRTFTFENGLKMFFLEDNSCATVTAELCVDAGFSSQTERNAGFLSVYAGLIGGEISSDAVRFKKTFAPMQSEQVLSDFSKVFEPLDLSNAELKRIFSESAKKYSSDAASVAGFINSSIDARVFPSSPWKNENGVSPATYASFTIAEVRSFFNFFSKNYFTPENAVLFLSGNISSDTAQFLAKKYFGDFSEINRDEISKSEEIAKEIQKIKKSSKSEGKKFVLHDDEFSPEMTQIVVQYTDFSMDEADILAAILNQDYGPYKQSVFGEKKLGVRGGEYINVASAQKYDSSRLIFQSLFEDTKQNPVEQTQIFLDKIAAIDFVSQKEVQFASAQIRSEFERLCDSSSTLLELVSQWRSLKKDGLPAESLFARVEKLPQIQGASAQKKFKGAEPFVFVLVNSKIFSKYEKDFKKTGFETVTRKNGAWYNQKFYSSIVKNAGGENSATTENSEIDFEKLSADDIKTSAERFVQENRSQFSTFTLSNNVPVTLKTIESAKNAVITMTVAGGEMLFPDRPGLSAVLTDCLAVNIRNQMDIMYQNGYIKGGYNVYAKTNATSSYFTVLCSANELSQTVAAISAVLIYSDISPALADGVTYDERTQWRIKTGSANFQLLCEAMRRLYAGSDYLNLFDEASDKPVTMRFVDIQAAYPTILDASRYSLVISGGVKYDPLLLAILNQTFGSLGSIEKTEFKGKNLNPPAFEGEIVKRIPIRHLFLTDVPAEKAGPRPAVLIPTTKFLDPILYCLKTPALDSKKSALFNALLFELAERMQENIKTKDTKVSAIPADFDYLFARIVVSSVERTAPIDEAYKSAVASLKADFEKIEESAEKNPLLLKIENRWVLNSLSQTATPEGTANLIQFGTALSNPQLYLDEYECVDKATAEDYISVLSEFFPELPKVRIYSSDSKK